MYLSRVELDPTRRSTMTALAAPQKFHGAVESAFSGERRRRLWRLDRLGEKLYLLLLSEEMPDLSGVVEQFAPERHQSPGIMTRCWRGSHQAAAGSFGWRPTPPKAAKTPKNPQRGEPWPHTARHSTRSSGCWIAPQSTALP